MSQFIPVLPQPSIQSLVVDSVLASLSEQNESSSKKDVEKKKKKRTKKVGMATLTVSRKTASASGRSQSESLPSVSGKTKTKAKPEAMQQVLTVTRPHVRVYTDAKNHELTVMQLCQPESSFYDFVNQQVGIVKNNKIVREPEPESPSEKTESSPETKKRGKLKQPHWFKKMDAPITSTQEALTLVKEWHAKELAISPTEESMYCILYYEHPSHTDLSAKERLHECHAYIFLSFFVGSVGYIWSNRRREYKLDATVKETEVSCTRLEKVPLPSKK